MNQNIPPAQPPDSSFTSEAHIPSSGTRLGCGMAVFRPNFTPSRPFELMPTGSDRGEIIIIPE